MRFPWTVGRARWVVWLLLLAVGGACYLFWPRRADLRRFGPATMGRMETAMWRQYYERRYVRLLWTLYALNRSEYGFSPWDSARLATYAARAAAAFQPTRSRAEAQAALPLLTRYFGLIHRRADGGFDAGELARLELEWWQQRRENAPPDAYGAVIAQVEARLYGVPEHDLEPSASLRARTMAFRDARGNAGMRPADWSHIEQELTRSYQGLQAVVNRQPQRVRRSD